MDELEIQGKKYISSKRAAELTGYAKDYIGQLIRAGKITGVRFGRAWYVLEDEVLRHANAKDLAIVPAGAESVLYKKAAVGTPLGKQGSVIGLLPSNFNKTHHLPSTWSSVRYLEDDTELLPRLSEKEVKVTENKVQIEDTKIPEDAVVYVRKETQVKSIINASQSNQRVKALVDGIAPRTSIIRVATPRTLQKAITESKKMPDGPFFNISMLSVPTLGTIAILGLFFGLSGLFLSSQSTYISGNSAYTANVLGSLEHIQSVFDGEFITEGISAVAQFFKTLASSFVFFIHLSITFFKDLF